MRTKSGRAVQVFVRSDDKRGAHPDPDVRRQRPPDRSRRASIVATNRFVRVANLRVAKKVKTVKATARRLTPLRTLGSTASPRFGGGSRR